MNKKMIGMVGGAGLVAMLATSSAFAWASRSTTTLNQSVTFSDPDAGTGRTLTATLRLFGTALSTEKGGLLAVTPSDKTNYYFSSLTVTCRTAAGTLVTAGPQNWGGEGDHTHKLLCFPNWTPTRAYGEIDD